MGLNHVASSGIHDALVLIDDYVEDKVNPHHVCGLLQVFPNRVSFKESRDSSVLNHMGMVICNSPHRSGAGHHGLSTARVACKIVELYIGHAEAEISFNNLPKDIHSGASGSGADVDHILYVVVDHPDCLVNLCAYRLAQLLFTHRPVEP